MSWQVASRNKQLQEGIVNEVTTARIFDDNHVQIDSKSISFASAGSGGTVLSSNVVFNVPQNTEVARLRLLNSGGATQFERDNLSISFTNSGTLTISQFDITLSNGTITVNIE